MEEENILALSLGDAWLGMSCPVAMGDISVCVSLVVGWPW